MLSKVDPEFLLQNVNAVFLKTGKDVGFRVDWVRWSSAITSSARKDHASNTTGTTYF